MSEITREASANGHGAGTQGSLEALAMNRQTNMQFLLKDFEKIFDVYIYSHNERSEATRMFVMLSTVPFILLSLFGIASKIDFDKTFSEVVAQFPSLVFLIFTVFGIAGIVPFHRFVAAHCNAYKMIRYMNNYRLFYYQLIKEEIHAQGWTSAIEKDPRHPRPTYLPKHWTSMFAYAMATLNIAYVLLGLYFWNGNGGLIVLIPAGIMMALPHMMLAKSELDTLDIRLIEENVDVDKLLQKISNGVESS